MRWLRQSTAFTFPIGPFVDSTDGDSPETALSITQADIQISKNGGVFAPTSDAAPVATHDIDGWYRCPLTIADTNTLGLLTIKVRKTGALVFWDHFLVVPAWYYDQVVLSAGIEAGVAQGGAAGSITLRAGASAVTDRYKGMVARILGNTGAGQSRTIVSYNGNTKAATVDPDWDTTPDNTSVYVLDPVPPNGILAGSLPGVNTLALGGNSNAANNIASAYSGGTYNIGGIDVAQLNAIVTDLVNGGRLDLLLDLIKAKTDNLPSDPADQSLITASIDSIASLIGLPNTSLAADIAALNDLDQAGVQAALSAQGLTSTVVTTLRVAALLSAGDWTRVGDTITLSDGTTLALTEDANGRVMSIDVTVA